MDYSILPKLNLNNLVSFKSLDKVTIVYPNNLQNKYILTFGYGNRKDYELLLDYFDKFAITWVIDVRLNPRAWSRKWYGDQVEKLCHSQGIKYVSQVSLGNTSGNYKWLPPNQEAANTALQEVAEIANSGNILLMCAEKDWQRCHRTEVAIALAELTNIPVKHLV